MEKRYEALQTEVFTNGDVVAGIIKGHKYIANKEQEYFISDLNETIHLPKMVFDEYFREIKQKSYQLKAKNRYKTSGKTVAVYLTLHPTKDQDIIDRLEEMKETTESKHATKGGRNGKSEYIRRLIREDIARQKEEQLQELKEMLDDGLITQEDFEQKKKQILGL